MNYKLSYASNLILAFRRTVFLAVHASFSPTVQSDAPRATLRFSTPRHEAIQQQRAGFWTALTFVIVYFENAKVRSLNVFTFNTFFLITCHNRIILNVGSPAGMAENISKNGVIFCRVCAISRKQNAQDFFSITLSGA